MAAPLSGSLGAAFAVSPKPAVKDAPHVDHLVSYRLEILALLGIDYHAVLQILIGELAENRTRQSHLKAAVSYEVRLTATTTGRAQLHRFAAQPPQPVVVPVNAEDYLTCPEGRC